MKAAEARRSDGNGHKPGSKRSQAGAEPSKPAGVSGSTQHVETAIVLRLGASLMREPPQEVTFIDVSCEAETVTLAGRVDSQTRREMVERVVGQHPDVLAIVNHLEVQPVAGPDGPARR